jgi:ribonuclease
VYWWTTTRDLSNKIVVSPVIKKEVSQQPSPQSPVRPAKKVPHVAGAPGVPAYALKTLNYVRANRRAPEGYEGGRTFTNYQRVVPYADSQGRRISYQEWDVHEHRE